LEETGTVVHIEADEISVRFDRTEACKKCGACKLGQDGEMLIVVHNTLGAKIGDRISVALEEGDLFGASLLAYGMPLGGLLLGMLLGMWIAPLFPSVNRDLIATVGAAVLMLVAFGINHLLEPLHKAKKKYLPVPVKIHETDNEP